MLVIIASLSVNKMYLRRKISTVLLAGFMLLGCVQVFSTTRLMVEKKGMSQQFSDIANAYETSLFDYMPELDVFLGKTDVARDRFMDASITPVRSFIAIEKRS